MRFTQEAYDAERAALAKAVESASRRQSMLKRVKIFPDAQAATGRMASDETGPGPQILAPGRKHMAALRRARPGIILEMKCPSHKRLLGRRSSVLSPW